MLLKKEEFFLVTLDLEYSMKTFKYAYEHLEDALNQAFFLVAENNLFKECEDHFWCNEEGSSVLIEILELN